MTACLTLLDNIPCHSHGGFVGEPSHAVRRRKLASVVGASVIKVTCTKHKQTKQHTNHNYKGIGFAIHKVWWLALGHWWHLSSAVVQVEGTLMRSPTCSLSPLQSHADCNAITTITKLADNKFCCKWLARHRWGNGKAARNLPCPDGLLTQH